VRVDAIPIAKKGAQRCPRGSGMVLGERVKGVREVGEENLGSSRERDITTF